MSRPGVGSGGRRSAVLVGALLLLPLGLESISDARAFPSQPPAAGDEASYAEAGRTSSEPADDTAGRFGDGEGTYGPERRAQELYLDGIAKLGAGHREIAQQTFESVVARFPDSAAADLARRRLGELYRATSDGAPATAATVSAAAPALAPAATAPPGRSPLWQQELRRNAPIQTKLRGEAGDRVFFSAGSTELGTRARMALAAQAQWLIRWREFEAAVEGHADEPGTAEDNLTLSRQRAEAVRQRLIEEGVEASRISVVAAGSTQRVATCSAPDCSSQNRRAITLVFANGTRARLGLAGPATADASTDRAPGPATPKSVAAPVVPQQVGVTR
jgi:outer membrane protein OmpA-like peptidoglycan-associated protein